MKRLSIIVPIYNPKIDRLKRCLSCFQDIENNQYEAILINDGSCAEISDELRNYAVEKPWIKVIEEENKGVSTARNCGVNEAEGTWISFCDADDEIDVKKALLIIKNLENKACDFIYAPYEKVKNNQYKNIDLKSFNSSYLLQRCILNQPNLYGTVWAKFFKKRLLKEKKIKFRSELSHAEDTIFLLDYLNEVNEVHFSKLYFYTYYSYQNSITKLNSNAINKYLNSMKYVTSKYEGTSLEKESANFCMINLLIMMVNYIWKRGISYKDGKFILKKVLNSDELKYALNNYDPSQLTSVNRILIFALKHKAYYFCFLACRYRNM